MIFLIRFENVTKIYKGENEVVALKNIDLTINDGEIWYYRTFGAGKSTLVRCINLLETPDEGRVLVDGVDMMNLTRAASTARVSV